MGDGAEPIPAARTAAPALAALAPIGPYFPDFLTPVDSQHDQENSRDALMSTPRRRLRDELCQLAGHAPVPDWVRPLAEGDHAALTRLGAALRGYYEAAIAPHRDLIQATVDADRARRAHGFLNGGMLATLYPIMRWHAPVLEVDYSIDQDLRWPDTKESGALDALLGRTRATVLHAIDTGSTTTNLARRLRISAASASRHTTVLRDAGLIATHRDGPAVLHTITPLGRRLLAQRRNLS